MQTNRRKIMTVLSSLLFRNLLIEEIDNQIGNDPKSRFYALSVLGFGREEDDLTKPLSFYAAQALEPREIKEPILTVDSDDCETCRKKYSEHPPCESKCPVGAVSHLNKTQSIQFDLCTSCGKCLTACPNGSIADKSQIVDVIQLIQSGRKTAAMISPAISRQFNISIETLSGAIKSLGFEMVAEVAAGADITARTEAEEFKTRLSRGEKLMTTSCCPAYTQTAKRHIPEIMPHVSATKSPLYYTSEQVLKRFPDAGTVFIGPCLAKKIEGIYSPVVNYTLSAQELDVLFDVKEIDFTKVKPEPVDIIGSKRGRGFAVTKGVAGPIQAITGDSLIPYYVDGLTKETIQLIKNFTTDGCPGNFVEVMACEGGCVAGPLVIKKN